jgi:hypothetical protein
METLEQNESELIRFGAEVQRLKDAGTPEGKAILTARKKHPTGYSEWCKQGRPQTL